MKKLNSEISLIAAIKKHAIPMKGQMTDYDDIISAAKDKIFVMIGCTTHGTKEFYRTRAEITGRLIQDMHFDALAIESDWQGALRINNFTQSLINESAEDALSGFNQFPTWLWRNNEIINFIEWLRIYNTTYRKPEKDNDAPVNTYGIDIYGMKATLNALLNYLNQVDSVAAKRARRRFKCLENFINPLTSEGPLPEFDLNDSCAHDAAMQLFELRRKADEYIKKEYPDAENAYFHAKQNANILCHAEEYYRSIMHGDPDSWNIRNRHMFETLEDLAHHLGTRLGRPPRIAVWAHNAHIGNARATEMNKRGELNVGQLIEDKYKDKSLLIGITGSCGTVLAADNWDEPGRVKKMNRPLPGSYEELFYGLKNRGFVLDLRDNNAAVAGLVVPRLQRSIGVIYKPETERYSHYLEVCLPEQFNFLLHFDETTAIKPLDTQTRKHYAEYGETYPSGL